MKQAEAIMRSPTDPILMEPIAEQIWQTRYRLIEDGHFKEADIRASWARVALALSAPEAHHRDEWRQRASRMPLRISGFCRAAASFPGLARGEMSLCPTVS